MVGLTILEVYKCTFNMTEENNKFEIYINNFDEFLFTKVKKEVAEIFGFSKITPKLLEHYTVSPRITKTYEKWRSKKSNTNGYLILLIGFAQSPSRDFESSLRILVGLDEKNNHLILKHF